MTEPGDSTDVVVVGAGLAGLSAASALQAHGRSVRVLEARAEVGGRLRSRVVAGQTVDLGGEFVGSAHERVRALAGRMGIALERSGLCRGPIVWTAGGRRSEGRVPRLPPHELARALRAAASARRLARQIDPGCPWRSSASKQLDSRSVAEWLARTGTAGRAAVLIRAVIEGFATVSLDKLSLLHLLWWIRRGGLVGATRWRVGGGAQRIAEALAAGLSVELGSRVEAIEQSPSAVAVHTGGRELRARRAIAAIPLPALRDLRFEPPLPHLQRAATRISFGQASTVVIAGRLPHRQALPVAAVGDIAGGLAWRRGGAIKALVMAGSPWPGSTLRQSFRTPTAELVECSVNWSEDPSCGGTYLAPQPGELCAHGAGLRLSHGRVHFAAAERSSWPNSMEGALESGEQAAAEVLAELPW